VFPRHRELSKKNSYFTNQATILAPSANGTIMMAVIIVTQAAEGRFPVTAIPLSTSISAVFGKRRMRGCAAAGIRSGESIAAGENGGNGKIMLALAELCASSAVESIVWESFE
jgi:hypothetical protein